MPSQYDNRISPAYDSVMKGLVDPKVVSDPFILKWWSSIHDELIRKLIEKWQWYWFFHITEEVVKNTDAKIIDAWKREDPACRRGVGKGAWYNVLSYFAYARSLDLGLSDCIRKPRWKRCPLCSEMFLENSLPEPLAKRLGVNRLDFCAPCLKTRILQNTGNDSLPKEEVKNYLTKLSSIIQAVPHQGYGEGIEDLLFLNDEQRLAFLRLAANKPKTRHVKKLFKSWLHALIEADILEHGTRRTSRGTTCLANDGHTCYSLAEKTIDDFLYFHGVPHEREPTYPNSKYRADFLIKGVYIEYFGLAGNSAYDKKIKAKSDIARLNGIRLIAIYPENLINMRWLRKTLLEI